LAQDPKADEDGHNAVFAPSSAEDIDQLEIVYSVHRNAEDKPITGATIQLLRDGFVENDLSFCGLIAEEPASYLFEKLLSSAVSVISSIDGGQTITVCVPLPVRALANASFVEILRRRIRASRVSPESMCLVVDVPSLIVQGSRGLGLLSDARSIGLGIGLARFDQHDRGLDFVRSLPATHLMMDGQFADYLIRENFQLLQSSKGLADELGRMLVATNVSTSASQAVLQDLGVTVEGPVNGSPVSAAQFIEIASIASVSQADQR
jgi:EAL domain-containing protein (putative c-di-GMP-specific phosphodiesterase class I)